MQSFNFRMELKLLSRKILEEWGAWSKNENKIINRKCYGCQKNNERGRTSTKIVVNIIRLMWTENGTCKQSDEEI